MNNIQYTLLGLLAREPLSGYEIKQQINSKIIHLYQNCKNPNLLNCKLLNKSLIVHLEKFTELRLVAYCICSTERHFSSSVDTPELFNFIDELMSSLLDFLDMEGRPFNFGSRPSTPCSLNSFVQRLIKEGLFKLN